MSTSPKAYEILFIIKPHLPEETNQEIISAFQGWITNNEGEVTLMNPWGIKELATVLDKFTHGYYVQCQFKGTNKTLNEIKNRIAVSETIFRHLLVTLDSVFTDKKPKEKKARAPKAVAATVEG